LRQQHLLCFGHFREAFDCLPAACVVFAQVDYGWKGVNVLEKGLLALLVRPSIDRRWQRWRRHSLLHRLRNKLREGR
jgi:hypothetical protein